MSLEPVPLDAIAPAARKLAGPSAPEPARMMAARGLAPLSPRDLCAVLTFLHADPVEAVALTARQTLGSLPERILDGALREALHPAVLHGLARSLGGAPRWAELLLLNPGTHDDTVCFLAGRCEERQLEIIAQNEMRLLRAPRIIEALYMNPRTRMSTVDRVLELAVRNGLELTAVPAFQEAQAAILGVRATPAPLAAPVVPGAPGGPVSLARGPAVSGTAPTGAPAPTVSPVPGGPSGTARAAAPAVVGPTAPSVASSAATEEAGDLTAAEVEALSVETPVAASASSAGILSSGALSADDHKGKGNIQALLVKMTASQRVRWAVLGNREVRGYLMRDSNRMVAIAAIRNPRVTEQEVVGIATSRSVNDEVIRVIGTSREWTKSYQVRVNLVNNPRCPLPTALQLLRTLRQADVRSLAKSKNVPTAVTQAARRLVLAER